MDIILVHGQEKHHVNIENDATVEDLMMIVTEKTSIPCFNQKLIYKGVSLTKDAGRLLHTAGVKNNAKIMVIGQKHDPEEEELLRKLEEIKKAVSQMQMISSDLRENWNSVRKGFLQESLVEKSLDQIRKKVVSCAEKAMKTMENLDEITVQEKFVNSRTRKKLLISQLHSILDTCDTIADDIANFKCT